MNATVNGTEVTDVTYVPADESGPWVVAFSRASISPELDAYLENPEGLVPVGLVIDEVSYTGNARVNLSEIEVTLVGRGALVAA